MRSSRQVNRSAEPNQEPVRPSHKVQLPVVDQIRLYEALTGFEFKRPLNETEILKMFEEMKAEGLLDEV